MTQGVQPTATAQGAINPFTAHYETRTGLFAGPRTYWDGADPPAPAPAIPPAAQGATTTPSAQNQDNGGNVGDQIARGLANLINRQGSPDRAAELLYTENGQYRARIRELEGQLPAEGAVVLTPAQAQQWTAYQAIDADPAALRTRLEQGSSALERETGRILAEASGANADVLSDRLRVSGLRAEVRDVPAAEGRPAGRAVHLLNAEGQDQGELRAYATQHWGAFVPALFPTQTAQPQGGTVVSPQAGAGGNPAPVNPIAAALGRTEAAQPRTVVDPFATPPVRN